MNICVQVFMWYMLSFPLGKYLGVVWLEYMVGRCLIFFKKMAKLFPKVIL